MNILGQVIGILKPENRKVGKGILTFLRRSRSHMPSTCTSKSIPSCMTVHDNVAIAVIVSEIWAFKDFPLNLC